MRPFTALGLMLLAPALHGQTEEPLIVWIDRLGHPEWDVRQQAERALLDLGPVARPALEARAGVDGDLEVRARIASVLSRLDLMSNGGVEVIDGASGEPDGWTLIGSTLHSTDASGGSRGGLFDPIFEGVTAHEGRCWLSACSLGGGSIREVVSRALVRPLTQGRRYVLSAWLHGARDESFAHPGTFEVALGAELPWRLEPTHLIGRFEPVDGRDGWARRTIEFTAPRGCEDLPWIVFTATATGDGDAWIGIDGISLDPVPPSAEARSW